MKITASSVNSALIWTDRVCDYIPGASTMTNLIDIFEKCVLKGCSSKSIKENRYFSHVKKKNSQRCIVLLVPILGNIIIAIYDLIQHQRAKVNGHEEQNFQARLLGLDVNQLPQNFVERQQIIENKRQEKIKESLDMQIFGLRQSIEKFRKIINDPQEPLVVSGLLGVLGGVFEGTQNEKINHFWSNFKLMYSLQGLGNIFLKLEPDQNDTIIQKQQEISQLKNECLELRQISYHNFILILKREELLSEAKKYYLESFRIEERKGVKESLEQMTLETILPKLKERVLAQAKNDYEIVEMQEIISRIENI